MQCSKETKILNTVCVLLVLFAGCTRLLIKHHRVFSCNGVIFALFTAAILIWICQLQRRLLQVHVRKNLTVTAGMMIFWMALRTVKYEFLSEGHFTARYAWYLYYIPLIFISLLLFLSVLHIGRPHNCPISRWWNLFYIPSVILVFGIMTNDYHQLAFYFPNGISNWNDNSYTYGPVYYAVVVWLVVLFLSMLLLAFVRCAVPVKRKKIWVPMLPFFAGILYTLFILMKIDNVWTKMFMLPEIGCFLFAAFMESLLVVGLFPSNDSYGDFWNASSIGAGIMDEEGVIRYQSEHSISVSSKQIQKAEKQTVFLEDGNIALKSHRINGGFGYWIKDLSEINRLNQQLADLGDVLVEENAMLDAENKMAEERIRIHQQNALYDSIAKSVSPKLDKISGLLDTLTQEEKNFEQTMKYVCILTSYVKRYSNLLLLLHQDKQIDSGELCLAISETLDYVRLYGTKAYLSHEGEKKLEGEVVLLAYKCFETLLEAVIPGVNAILVNLYILEAELSMQIELDASFKILSEKGMKKEITAIGGTLNIETEGQTQYISLSLPAGGENV